MNTAKTIKAPERIEALDFTKGILVIFMVIYHSLNYHGVFPNRYIPFVAPAFIMLAGFIITQIYFPKYGRDINGARIRLAVRAIKLLLIFTILNLAGRMIWPLYHYGITFELEDFFGNWIDIYLIGTPRTAAFEVLLPISYTLILSILIPRFKSITPYFIIICAITIFSASILMEYYRSTVYTIPMISAGIIGMAIGLLPLPLINAFARSWIKIFSLFVLYGVCAFFCGYYYYTQIFSAIIVLLIIYSTDVRINFKNLFQKQSVLLGQYSLLSYIIQIAYLKIIFTMLTKWRVDKPNIIITILIITIITYVTILILDYARPKYKYIDVLYKTIFA
jgi:hypothetical protein